MKLRNGFVSNSSSSSFVIAKSFLSEAQLHAMKEFFIEMEEEYGSNWGDSYNTWEEDDNYISAETHRIWREWQEFSEKNDIPVDKLFWMEG